MSNSRCPKTVVNVTVKNALVWHEMTSFTFDNDAQGWQKDGEWQAGWGATPVAQSLALGNGALAVSGVYSGANDWEELRIVSPPIANLSKVQRVSFSVYYPVSAYDSSSSLAQQVRPYIVLNPGWSKQGVDTVTGKLNSYPKVTLNGAEYFKVEFSADWDKLEGITQLYIGHTQRRGWKFWQASPVDRLIEAAEGIDVRLFPQAQPA